MELLGVASSVAGLAAFSGQLAESSRKLRGFCEHFIHAKEELRRIIGEIDNLRQLLDNIGFEQDGTGPSIYLQSCVGLCAAGVSRITQITERLDKVFKAKRSSAQSHFAKFQYALTCEDIAKMKTDLEFAKSTLSIAYQVYRETKASKQSAMRSGQLQNILAGQNILTRLQHKQMEILRSLLLSTEMMTNGNAFEETMPSQRPSPCEVADLLLLCKRRRKRETHLQADLIPEEDIRTEMRANKRCRRSDVRTESLADFITPNSRLADISAYITVRDQFLDTVTAHKRASPYDTVIYGRGEVTLFEIALRYHAANMFPFLAAQLGEDDHLALNVSAKSVQTGTFVTWWLPSSNMKQAIKTIDTFGKWISQVDVNEYAQQRATHWNSRSLVEKAGIWFVGNLLDPAWNVEYRLDALAAFAQLQEIGINPTDLYPLLTPSDIPAALVIFRSYALAWSIHSQDVPVLNELAKVTVERVLKPAFQGTCFETFSLHHTSLMSWFVGWAILWPLHLDISDLRKTSMGISLNAEQRQLATNIRSRCDLALQHWAALMERAGIDLNNYAAWEVKQMQQPSRWFWDHLPPQCIPDAQIAYSANPSLWHFRWLNATEGFDARVVPGAWISEYCGELLEPGGFYDSEYSKLCRRLYMNTVESDYRADDESMEVVDNEAHVRAKIVSTAGPRRDDQ